MWVSVELLTEFNHEVVKTASDSFSASTVEMHPFPRRNAHYPVQSVEDASAIVWDKATRNQFVLVAMTIGIESKKLLAHVP